MRTEKTLCLFTYDFDALAFEKHEHAFGQLHAGFDLFSFPSNARLAWFDMARFTNRWGTWARKNGATAVVSHHEQFGALCAALIAEKMHWPGTPVKAVLACQHKLYARQILAEVAPEANVAFQRLTADYGEDIPEGITYPCFVKPIKAAFSVLAKTVHSKVQLQAHTRFSSRELWVIRHLVEPFERICKRYLPEAGSSHSLLLEAPVTGLQYCLDGYVFNGEAHLIGVANEVMYPGTQAFMSFEYPCSLTADVQAQAFDIARRFLLAIGFDHGQFNMEFFHDAATGSITVIEFNPRASSQFSDFYAQVEGWDLHEIALWLAHGLDPAHIEKRKPVAGAAASFVYRCFSPEQRPPMPNASAIAKVKALFPHAIVMPFPKDSAEIARDFKWLGSYRYGLLNLHGKDANDLRKRCQQASAILNWTAPYETLEHEQNPLSLRSV